MNNFIEQNEKYEELINEVRAVLEKDLDYGKAGLNITKPSLLQSGALKLIQFFGYERVLERVKNEIDFTNQIYIVEYKCILSKKVGETDKVVSAYGSANSKEPAFAGKIRPDSPAPAQHFLAKANTINQIAEKRAIVRAIRLAEPVLVALFTQDIEDMSDDQKKDLVYTTAEKEPIVITDHTKTANQSVAEKVKQNRLQNEFKELFRSSGIFQEPTNENIILLIREIVKETKSKDIAVWIENLTTKMEY